MKLFFRAARRGRVRVAAPALLSIILIGVVASTASSQTPPPLELHGERAPSAPKLDGVLDDAVWAREPMPLEGWASYDPLRGEPARQRTSVWVAYDDEALYFAFRCFDDEPSKIRTTITRRDNAWNDDWIGVSLDSTHAGQVAYHMFVNPSGIQIDALNTGTKEDSAADWVWQSAGRVDAQGYAVEMRVPLESIRFRGGADVRMGVLFFRHSSRMGVSWSSPAIAPGQWVFETHALLTFLQLRQPRVLEVIPSVTASANQARELPQPWPGVATKGDLGASVKYGITSTITLDATVNPDFSQVESDAFQVEVNQRFPLFFDEKRPFFMEGLGLFNLAGTSGDGTMRTAVHTRRIVDPSTGVKLTGTAGRQIFALLSALDASPAGDTDKLFTIGRVMRNYGNGQYIGALVTDTELGHEHNRVAAADVSLRHSAHFNWSASLLRSDTRTAEGDSLQGNGGQAKYEYSTQRVLVMGQAEHYDRGFRMDTAFINRVGLSRGWQYEEVNFYPAAQYGWIKRIAPFLWSALGEDRIQGGSEAVYVPGVRFNFVRQGNLRLDMARGHETFAGRRFATGRAHADGRAQITRWLNVGGTLERADAVFYDPTNPFAGTQFIREANVEWQPNARLAHNLSYNYVRFERSTGEKVFSVHIVNLRNTYQFTPRFFIRAIAQFDSAKHHVLGDFLASYELMPGTVAHAGYGSILESINSRPYTATARALFFKVSYLARL
jgi:Domain of unknown function (DUF5916)/Carbohydrate family 9 binding domain-like